MTFEVEPSESLLHAAQPLVAAIGARDTRLEGHSVRVAQHVERIAKLMGLSKEAIEESTISALLHDVGMFGVAESVLLKVGPLTDEDRAAIQSHPHHGSEILLESSPLTAMARNVMHHHENIDGSGYPFGLSGDEIPTGAKLIRVADTFDAMTTPSHYQQRLDAEIAIEEMGRYVGARYDKVVMDAFVEMSNS